MNVVKQEHDGRFIVVRVGERCCVGFPLSSVREVTRPLPIDVIAGVPAFVRGVSVVRACPIPVIDLAIALGVEAAGEASRFAVLRVGERSVAVAVAAVVGITDVGGASLDRPPPLLGDASGALVDAVGALDGELLFVLRASRLVPDDVLHALEGREAGAA